MLTLIGNGGHAKVIRDLVRLREAASPDIFDGDLYILAIGDNKARLRESSAILENQFATLIHPAAAVSDTSTVDVGSVVMAGAVVQADVTIGKHCIINTCAVVDHDAVLSDFVHVAPGGVVCGGARLGEGVMIGANGTVLPYTHVPDWYKVRSNECFHYSKVKSEESFWARVQKTAGCWEWMAAKNHNGYGIVSRRSGNGLAHRVAWSLLHGDIPEGMSVLHKCDVRACVNPDHLFLGTQAENVMDMVRKGRNRGGYTKAQREAKIKQ